MGNRSEKGNLSGGCPGRKPHGHKKNPGPLIAVLLTAGRIFALDPDMAEITEPGRTLVSVQASVLNADMNDWSGVFQTFLGNWDMRLTGGWTCLGKFEMVESEDFAYRNVSVVEGYSLHGTFSCLVRWYSLNFGLAGGAETSQVGGGLYGDTAFLAAARLKWHSPIGYFTGRAAWFRDAPCIGAEYFYEGHIGRTGYGIGVFGEWNENGIVGVRAEIRSFRKDLRFGAVFRYGLVFPVYRVLTLEAEKTWGNYRVSAEIVPSMLENTLITLRLSWYPEPVPGGPGPEI